jgi:PAS domain S-box-containing protein
LLKSSVARINKSAQILALLWTLLLMGSLIWNIHDSQRESQNLAIQEARALFAKDLAFRTWATSHGGVYVPLNARTPANPNLKHIPDRDLVTPSGVKLTLMNPAYMLRQIMSEYPSQYGARGHLTSLKPLWEGNVPDEWETKALRAFENGVEEVFEFNKTKGETALRLMKPMYTKEGCLLCHSFQGYKVGDVRGGVGVSVPMTQFHELQIHHNIVNIISHSGLWIIGLIGILLFSNKEKKIEIKRIKAETSVAESEAFLKTIIDGVAEPIMVIGTDYKIRMMNRKAKEAVAHAEEGMFCYSASHKQDTPCTGDNHQCPLTQVLQTREPCAVTHIHKDSEDNELYIEILASPLYDATGEVIGIIESNRDITERKLAEDKVLVSLAEKDVLLKEVHHRVKNNMAIIASLLRMQSRKVDDKKYLDMFIESQGRIKSMALIHERLYMSKNLANVNVENYIRSLAATIHHTYASSSPVDVTLDVQQIDLSIETLMPCGLIINELLTNAFKYGTKEQGRDEIILRLKSLEDNMLVLSVTDSGKGLPEGFDIENNDGLGMQLVDTLSKQLSGELKYQSDSGGTTFSIIFPRSID